MQKVIQDLQNDLTDLALEARYSRNTGITGQFSGLFASSMHKDVKAAAEAAQVALRRIESASNPEDACQECTEVAEAAIMACAKTKKLCILALTIFQKLIAHHLLSPASQKRVIFMLRQIGISKHDDETIKLKLLQTCLTWLQLKDGIADPEAAMQVLATCFCLLSPKNSPTVVNTASAIVRQSVALVFEQAAESPPEATQPGPNPSSPSFTKQHVLTFQDPGDRTPPASPLPLPLASKRVSDGGADVARAIRSDDGSTDTALMVLHELCLMCRGHGSEALECRPLSVSFVLDIVCEALRTNVDLFRERQQYLNALQEDVYGALHFVLKAQLEAETEFVKVHTLQSVLQAVSVFIMYFGHLMAAKTEVLLVLLLAGVNQPTHFAQQVLCMNTLRALCMSPPTVYFLFATFDIKLDHQLRAVTQVLHSACDFVIAFTANATTPGNRDEESLALLATLWAQKMQSRQLTFEAELASHVSTGHGGMYIVMLAIDVITVLLNSIACIVDVSTRAADATPCSSLAPARTPSATECGALPSPSLSEPAAKGGVSAFTPRASSECMHLSSTLQTPRVALRLSCDAQDAAAVEPRTSDAAAPAEDAPVARSRQARYVQQSLEAQVRVWHALAPVTEDVCRLLVDCVWQPALEALTEILNAVTTEAFSVHVLRALQAMATVAGVLNMKDAMHAVIAAVCSFTVDSPPAVAGGAKGLAGLREAGPPGQQKSPASAEDSSVPFAAAAALPRPREEGTVLTPRNVQAFRTVFNMTHALFEVLGPKGWHLVLSTLAVLDAVLCSPATTTLQKATSASAEPEKHSELSVLDTATVQLFATTAFASEATVDTMMHTLLGLSQSSVERVQTGAPRCFALDHMADIVIHNPRCISRLFDVFLKRILEMTASPSSAARAAAVNALQRTAMALFERSKAAITEGSAGPDEAVECCIMRGIEEVFQQPNAPADVQFACLDMVHHLIQAYGEAMQLAWPTVLSLLEQVATRSKSSRLVRIGHECMELVITDFLPSLGWEQLRRTLHTEACYVLQHVEVNTCYAASLTLWRAADSLGCALQLLNKSGAKVCGGERNSGKAPQPPQHSGGLLQSASNLFNSLTGRSLESQGIAGTPRRTISLESQTSDVPGTSGTLNKGDVLAQLAVTLSSQHGKGLLLFVMESAQRISLDSRPEVRTSGIKLLFDIMTRHGVVLLGDEGRVWDMAFPLLMEVAKNVLLSDEAHAQSAPGSSVQDNAAPMNVHHSRDTFTKQWVETLEKALRGWTAYLKVMLIHVMHLPCFKEDWLTLVRVLKSLITMEHLPDDPRTRKIATASLAFFVTVVAPQAEDQSTPPFLWDAVWQALLDAVATLADASTVCHHSVRTRFVQMLVQMYSVSRTRVSLEDYQMLLRKLADFVASPVSKAETWPPSFLPPVQSAVLSVLPSLLPPPAKGGWDAVLDFLCSQLRPLDSAPAVEAPTMRGEEVPTSRSHELVTETTEAQVRRIWMKDLSEKVLELFKSHMPLEVRARGFQKLVDAYLPGVGLRWREPASANISRSLMQHFCALVDMGLPALHMAAVHKASKVVAEVWKPGVWDSLYNVFLEAFRTDLPSQEMAEGPATQSTQTHTSALAEARLHKVVLECLCNTVLAACGPAEAAAKQRLVSIIDSACATPANLAMSPGDRLPYMALHNLYALCIRAEPQFHDGQGSASHSTHFEVACIALPIFLHRCRNILLAFACQHSAEPASTTNPANLPAALAALPSKNTASPPAPTSTDNPQLSSLAAASTPTTTLGPLTIIADSTAGRSTEAAAVLRLSGMDATAEPASPHQSNARPQMRPMLCESAAEAASLDSTGRTGTSAYSAHTSLQRRESETQTADAGLALLALQLLLWLRPQREVIDRALPDRKRLARLIRCAREVQEAAAESLGDDPVGQEATHLLFMHACVLHCAGVPDSSVRRAALAVLRATGVMLGLAERL